VVGAGRGLSQDEGAEVRAFLRLKALPGMGDRVVRTLVDRHGSGRGALAAATAQRRLWDGPDEDHDLAAWTKVGMDVVPMTSPRYPRSLLDLSDPPSLLFLQGRPGLLTSPAVAVVGSRRATEIGRRAAETLGARLARAGVTVVSGMAMGIDGAAHRGALGVGGNTVAVLGSGLGVVHPPSHRSLSRRIAAGGLLVSEFLPRELPRPFHFPRRNRIIAALAEAVIVVEAGQKSGALITVEHALDLGRDILVVPGSVENPQCRGSNALLRDGARVITDPEAVMEELPKLGGGGTAMVDGTPGNVDPAPSLPPELRTVWEVLSREASTVEEVARRASLAPGQAMAVLSVLELEGLAIQRPGLRFQRS
jgi:DNA processing protein